MSSIVWTIIVIIWIIYNNIYNDSYNNCDNLPIMIIIMTIIIEIIHQLILFFFKVDFCGFLMYDISYLISHKQKKYTKSHVDETGEKLGHIIYIKKIYMSQLPSTFP